MKTDVLIVGAGPAGLTLSMALHRLGIANRIIEKRMGVHSAPQAHVISARTMEIYRALGIEETSLRALATPVADLAAVRWSLSLAGPDIGVYPLATPERIMKMLTAGPTPSANISQNKLEPLLLDEARARGADVAFGREWVAMERDGGIIRSTVRDADGIETTIESRYLVGCDGSGSAVRKAAGIGIDSERVQANMNICLKGNFRSLVRDRPGVLYWVLDPEATGTFIAHDIDDTWVFMLPYDAEKGRLGDDEIRQAIRIAVGVDQDYEIVSADRWMMSADVAEHYGAGPVFLVGDAAHRFPPTGGMGLNTGAADAFNFAWKLAAVMQGRAGPELLATYEQERKPVARAICDASLSNHLKMQEVVAAIGVPGRPGVEAIREHLRAIPGDPDWSARVQAAIDNQAEHFDMSGLDIGQCYESGALLGDGSAAPVRANPVCDYIASGRPGARLPHIWLERAGERLSTLDLVDKADLTLFCGPDADGWADAATACGLPVVRLGSADLTGPDVAGWLDQCGIEPAGALLVRPDQHVACRFPRAATGAADDLQTAVGAVMRRVFRSG